MHKLLITLLKSRRIISNFKAVDGTLFLRRSHVQYLADVGDHFSLHLFSVHTNWK